MIKSIGPKVETVFPWTILCLRLIIKINFTFKYSFNNFIYLILNLPLISSNLKTIYLLKYYLAEIAEELGIAVELVVEPVVVRFLELGSFVGSFAP
ncbi:hypothetical protein BpHYR1_044954 [Brachionus plicatilis]|uniref:Uncharacterized protein n=1 Tax=Brachionus plicatilis TaxID=10195 RepID=A0A3M7S097_BRAPC|nr:hypothetical protein BpHYR1_044954 [Brachionus plicatilis]